MARPLDFDALLDTFVGDKRRKNPTARTPEVYRQALAEFGDWLATLPPEALVVQRKGERRPIVVVPGALMETADMGTDHIRCFITYLQTRDQLPGARGHSQGRAGKKLSPATVNNRYRALQSFVKWLWEQGEFGEGPDNPGANPMAVLSPPKVPTNEPDALELEQIRAVLATCGTGRRREFIDIRDEAIIRLFCEAGPRRREVATAQLEALNMNRKLLDLRGEYVKTNVGRALPFGDHTALALNRYLNKRQAHPKAHLPDLWLAPRGAFGSGGIYQMVRRRGQKAGITRLHPHLFRHSFANIFLDEGGTEDELKRLGGWESDASVRHYARARSARRALDAHRSLALGDRL